MFNPLKQPTLPDGAAAPFILQARCGSSRFARKVLQPFVDDLSLLQFQLMRLRKAFPSTPIIIATTGSLEDAAIEHIALLNGIPCFKGSEVDVIQRFLDCCDHFGFRKYIVRICADNPFLQTDLLQNLLDTEEANCFDDDYLSYSINGRPAMLTHFGFFAELIKVDALRRVAIMTNEPVYREHVTNYIYQRENEKYFKVRWIPMDELADHLQSIRLTVDSVADLKNAQYLYEHFRINFQGKDPSWQDIVDFVTKDQPFLDNMSEQIKLYQK
jgi:spore coat polysaccharide biosynthesis protein SpsF (cytidylyltransferase family)